MNRIIVFLLKYIIAFIVIYAITNVAHASAPNQTDIDVYRALIKQDLRLATAGYRIAAANAAYCKDTVRSPGWVIHDIAQYPNTQIAKAAFGFKTPILIAGVVKDGPADKAQIEPNDGFVGIDGHTINWAAFPIEKRADDRLVSFKELLHEHFSEKKILSLVFSQGGKPVDVTLSPPSICASDFQIRTEGGIDAGADGKMVSVSLELAEYASGDSDLAAVVAHEMAHNILGHPAKLKSANTKRGFAGQFGKSRNAVLKTETEADQLSIWLLANAGFDTNAAIAFLQKLGNRPRNMLSLNRTHLPWKDRVNIMRQEAARYTAAPKTNGKAVPPLLAQ